MGKITDIYGTINTKKDIKYYIKDYYSNGKIIKFTLTDNENYNMAFSGKKESKMAIKSPSFNPLCNIRDILKICEETKYLKYKSITYKETDSNEIKNLPKFFNKHKPIKPNTKIIITDEVNNITISFNYVKK